MLIADWECGVELLGVEIAGNVLLGVAVAFFIADLIFLSHQCLGEIYRSALFAAIACQCPQVILVFGVDAKLLIGVSDPEPAVDLLIA